MTVKPRCFVYIDGYNWYHAIFKHHPEWKWLNVQSLFETLRPHEDVQMVNFFTAIVDEDNPESSARERHVRYIRALRTLPKVRMILGKFQAREVTCRAECGKVYIVPEEKKTDVNIAVEILSNAFANMCDHIVLVSGDSDAQPPIEWVRRNRPHMKVTVYVPALPREQHRRRLDFYNQIGVDCRFFPTDSLSGHQLKPTIKLSDGTFVVRPHLWQKVPVG